jgi:hypothetical protein
MPVVDIEANIKQLKFKIEGLTQEIFKHQGMLQTFQEFEKAGLEFINIPPIPGNSQNNEESIEELDSVQEKPE